MSSSYFIFLLPLSLIWKKKDNDDFIVIVFTSSCSCSLQTRKWRHKAIVFVSSFLCWLSSFLWKTKDDDDLWLSLSSPPFILALLEHKRWQKKSSLCLLFLAFIIFMKNRWWQQQFMIVIIFTSSSSSPSFQTWRRQHRTFVIVFFSFWPSWFLWKIKDDDDLWSLSSSSLHVLTRFKHEDDGKSYNLHVFFIFTFITLVKDRRQQWLIVLIFASSSCSCSSQTWKR